MKTYKWKGDPPDPQKLAEQMFRDEKDPRSVHYRRVLIRPRIRWGILLLFLGGLVALEWLLHFILKKLDIVEPWLALGACLLGLVYCMLHLKHVLVGIIHFYQRFAPESLRMRCRFEPSCSNYMLLSIEKYGPYKGAWKGIRRLSRCNIKGGGYDWP